MGQYWMPVNLTKREFINPHKLGTGLKLIEQLYDQGVGRALIILTAAMPERRGGGDLTPDPVIGRWAGDRIAIVGDCAEREDLRDSDIAEEIFGLCCNREDWDRHLVWLEEHNPEVFEHRKDTVPFTDVTDMVCRVIERELGGRFVGDGWRTFVLEGQGNV